MAHMISLLLTLVLGFTCLSWSGNCSLVEISGCEAIFKYKRVLVTAAHPDDIETIAGATVAQFVECGSSVSYVITTNGDKGWGKDTSMTSSELASIRMNEQLEAAKWLGVQNVTFLQQEDGRLDGVDPILLKYNLTKWIRTYQPDLVLTFSPEIDYATYRFGLMHEDHKITGMSTMNTLWPSARDYLNFIELYESGILPWICPEAWLFSFSAPLANAQSIDTVVLQITEELFDKKYQALLQHKSQYSDPEGVKTSLINIGKYVASSNIPDAAKSSMAEAFQRIHFL